MEEKTLETLAGEIASSGTVCRLKGTYRLDLAAAKTVVCGEERFGCLLALSRPGLVVDGREAVLYAEADAPLSEDVSLIFLTPQAKFASLLHLDIRFTYKQEPRSFAVRAVDCRAYGVSFEDCRVSMNAESRVNLIGLMLKACRDTPLETNADCCRLSRSRIDVRCFAEDDTRPSAVYGVVNRWANSFAAEDNFIFAATRGRGAEHRGELASAAPSVSDRKISPRRIAAVAAAAIMLLAVGLAFLLPPLLNSDSRYSTQRDYAWYFTDDYLSDFAKTAPYRVLFFNWYAETDREEFYVDSVCRRRDTGEMICFKEEIYHLETDTYYTLYFVPPREKIDFLAVFEETCQATTEIGGRAVHWSKELNSVRAWFSYENCNYFLLAEGTEEPEPVLNEIKALFA